MVTLVLKLEISFGVGELLTANCRFLILLEIIIDEPKDK
jgi:hypothetical protein